MVVSGTGIFNAYKFLVAKHREAGSAINEKLFTEINDSPEPAAVISRHSLPQEGVHEADPLCEQAIDMFIKLLGVELGNSALRYRHSYFVVTSFSRPCPLSTFCLDAHANIVETLPAARPLMCRASIHISHRFQPHGGCYIAGGGIAKKMKEQLVDG